MLRPYESESSITRQSKIDETLGRPSAFGTDVHACWLVTAPGPATLLVTYDDPSYDRHGGLWSPMAEWLVTFATGVATGVFANWLFAKFSAPGVRVDHLQIGDEWVTTYDDHGRPPTRQEILDAIERAVRRNDHSYEFVSTGTAARIIGVPARRLRYLEGRAFTTRQRDVNGNRLWKVTDLPVLLQAIQDYEKQRAKHRDEPDAAEQTSSE